MEKIGTSYMKNLQESIKKSRAFKSGMAAATMCLLSVGLAGCASASSETPDSPSPSASAAPVVTGEQSTLMGWNCPQGESGQFSYKYLKDPFNKYYQDVGTAQCLTSSGDAESVPSQVITESEEPAFDNVAEFDYVATSQTEVIPPSSDAEIVDITNILGPPKAPQYVKSNGN